MRQALEIAIDYMNERLEDHDCKYQRNPATEAERINILADIETVKEALAQPWHEKERCVGCEACIDTACGRDECPKGWRKAAQPEQEPVAKVKRNSSGQIYIEWLDGEGAIAALIGAEFYITPPQRTWVDMTDEEILAAPNNLIACIAYVRNKLKEKNNA